MPIFEITRYEKSSFHVFVEAEDEETAKEIADEVDSEFWTDNQDFEAYTEVSATPEKSDEDLQGRIIYKSGHEHYINNSNNSNEQK